MAPIESTEQNPLYTYPSAGTYTATLTARNPTAADTFTLSQEIQIVGFGLVNADLSSSTFGNGTGSVNNLGQGWFGKNGDDGSVAAPDWSAGLTTGTPGLLTHIKSSGSGTRMGQFFANNLTGTNWAFTFDLGGAGSLDKITLWAGTLADTPSGGLILGDDDSPALGLVNSDGWTSLFSETSVSATGSVFLNINQDLSTFDVLAVQINGKATNNGTTYDNFAIIQKIPLAGVDDSFTVNAAGTSTANLFSNEVTAINDPITVTAIAGEASSVNTQITLPSGALLTVAADGSFSYDPNGSFDDLEEGEQTSDSFTYAMSNSQGSSMAIATFTIVQPAAPSFSLLGDVTVAINSGEYSAENFAFDFDPNDDGQTFDKYVVYSENFGLFLDPPVIDDEGTLTFTPDTNAEGLTTITVTGYDTGETNRTTDKTFTITIGEPVPLAGFSVNQNLLFVGNTVQFTNTSTNAIEWEWDFDNDGTVDSTEQSPSFTYSTPGIYTAKLTARNVWAEDNFSDEIRVIAYGIVNADMSSTTFENGSGSQNSLGQAWYGKSGDNGSVDSPDWSTGLTTGTPGTLTQIKSSGSATRFGQFFANNLTGNNWALSFDLGGTGSFSQVRLWGGTLAANPSGAVLIGDNSTPSAGLVDANGWRSLLFESNVSATGNVALNIDADLSSYNVISIQFKAGAPNAGTTYDNFAFVQKTTLGAVDEEYVVNTLSEIEQNVLDNEITAYNDPITIDAINGSEDADGSEFTLPSGALLSVDSDGSFTYDPNGVFDDLIRGGVATDSFTYTLSNSTGTSVGTTTLSVYKSGFANWALSTNPGNSDFYVDADGNGQASGLDYIFGDTKPVSFATENEITAPTDVPADVILTLEASTDLNTWTPVLIYTDGEISFQDSTISISDGIITCTGEDDCNFVRYGASYDFDLAQ